MNSTKRFASRLRNFLPCHSIKISHLNYLSLFARQTGQRVSLLLSFDILLSLLWDIYIGIRDLVQNRIHICHFGDYLGTNTTPTISVNSKVTGNPEKPARERSALRLISDRALPYPPESLLQHILSCGTLTDDLKRDAQNCCGVAIIKSFKRGQITLANSGT